MMQSTSKKVDALGNIIYGSTMKEEFVHFTYDPEKQVPLRVESIGITHPDKKYYIERKHADYYVLEYIKKGKGYVNCDGKEYTVTKDCVYLIHPGMKHKYGADHKEPYEKIWINFFSGVFTEILSAYGLSGKIYFPDSGCLSYFEQLISLAEQNNDNDEIYLEASAIIFNIILKLVKNNTQRKVSQLANMLKETLDRSIYRKITIEDLAQESNISKSQMCREFKKYFEMTPYQYLLNRRINIAANLLLKTSMSIKEISEHLHFADEYYFSNIFKKKIGFSPRAYRKSNIQ